MVGIMTMSMNEETTKGLPDKRSFEERVFARFDAMDVRFEAIDARLEKLESRSYDTKPIWERALKAIMDLGLEVGKIKTKVGVIGTNVGVIETRVASIEKKVDKIEPSVASIETKVAAIETSVATIENKLGTVDGDVAAIRSDYSSLLESQRDFKIKIARRIDLVLETLVDTHENMRDSDARLSQLESKLA